MDGIIIPAFKLHGEDPSGIRWKRWLKKFEQFCIVKGFKSQEKQLAALKFFGGEDVTQIIEQEIKEESDDDDEKQDTDYNKAIARLTAQFTPTYTRVYERRLFRKIDMNTGEPLVNFIVRLREQAKKCSFEHQLEMMIMDQVVEKIPDDVLRRKLLAKDMNLEDMIQLGTTHEAVKAQLTTFQKPVSEVNQIQQNGNKFGGYKDNRNKDFQSDQCFSCGMIGHRSKDPRCPAIGEICRTCNRPGHFSKKCMTKKRRYEEQPLSN
jgi:hypothetical protein